VRASELLLQERTPRDVPVARPRADNAAVQGDVRELVAPATRHFASPNSPTPRTQLLSNGRYAVMITAAGSGYSRCMDMAVTRWREDSTRDHWGTWCYIRDMASAAFWSAAHQPTLVPADSYEAIFTEARAEFRRRDGDFETHTEIAVSPEDDVELRRVRITNHARARRTIEVTSYAEVALAPPAADALHPAFSNLFVQTQVVPESQAILCTRRASVPDGQAPWMLHLMAVHGADSLEVSFETDRMAFIGRGRSIAAPRSSPSAIASRSSRNRPRRSISPRGSPKRAMAPSASSASTATGASPTACSTSPGRTRG